MIAWWEAAPEANMRTLENALRRATAAAGAPVRLFFRADDIGVPSRNFRKLLAVFKRHDMPLALAVVPAWLTRQRWHAIRETVPGAARLWCWHQHGYRHANHEPAGKKQEFGTSRSKAALAADLLRGKSRLADILETDFFPVFTPPWNRCCLDCLELLAENGFMAVSRSRGARPDPPSDLPDICIDVDLHTRKESDAGAAWDGVKKEFVRGIESGCCGVMIHHQRMTDSAFGFLDQLLALLKRVPRLQEIGVPAIAKTIYMGNPSAFHFNGEK